MKPAVPTLAAAVIATAAAGFAFAQTAPQPAALSLQGFEQRREARIMAADSDGDGRISRAEFLAARGGKGDPAARFAKMDANGDGFLDRSEIDAFFARRFRRMDRDGNGVLTAQERAAAHAAHAARKRGDAAGA